MEHSTPSLSPCPNPLAWDSGTDTLDRQLGGTASGTEPGQRSILALSRAILSGTKPGTTHGAAAGQSVPERVPDAGDKEERLALMQHDGGLSLELAGILMQLEGVLSPAHLHLLDKVGVAFDRLNHFQQQERPYETTNTEATAIH